MDILILVQIIQMNILLNMQDIVLYKLHWSHMAQNLMQQSLLS